MARRSRLEAMRRAVRGGAHARRARARQRADNGGLDTVGLEFSRPRPVAGRPAPPRHGVERARWLSGRAVVRLAAVLVGFLLAGWFGAAIAFLALLALAHEPPEVLGLAMVATMVLAAVATAVEQPLTQGRLTLRFATDRPLAAGLGAASAVLLAVVTGRAALTERATEPSFEPSSRGRFVPPRPGPGSGAVIAVGVLALAVRVVGAPAVLALPYAPLVAALRAGRGYVGADGAATAVFPPLPAVITAFSPGPARVALILISLATVFVVMRLASRIAGPTAATAVGAVAAVLPSLWGQQLPEALAALFVAGAVTLAWPGGLTPGRAVAAGACVAAACLSRPEVIVLVPVLAIWLVLVRRGREATVLAGMAIVVLLPWSLHVHDQFGTWLPSTNLGATLAGSLTPATEHGRLLGAFDPRGTEMPGVTEGVRDRQLREEALHRASDAPLPKLVAARLLRGWELWPPAGVASARAARGLPTPGGTVGSLLEVAAAVLAAVTLWLRRGAWRTMLPVFALPLLFTLESIVLFGDRGLRGWIAPVVALGAGLELARRAAPTRETPVPVSAA